MTTRKHNEFLEADDSSDNGNDTGYDSEAADASKGRSSIVKSSRPAKRRRTSSISDSVQSDEYLSEGDEVDEAPGEQHISKDKIASSVNAQSSATHAETPPHTPSKPSPATIKDKPPKTAALP